LLLVEATGHIRIAILSNGQHPMRELLSLRASGATQGASRYSLSISTEVTMDFGIALPTVADSWKIVQRAEEL
jgi:hypothetical protein